MTDRWHFLERRDDSWRLQLYVKGRNLTARQLAGAMIANRMTEEQAAADWRLPVEAIREAVAYCRENKPLLFVEWAIEQLMLSRSALDTQSPHGIG
jgi:uncharacterized protein (DUF433 family)